MLKTWSVTVSSFMSGSRHGTRYTGTSRAGRRNRRNAQAPCQLRFMWLSPEVLRVITARLVPVLPRCRVCPDCDTRYAGDGRKR